MFLIPWEASGAVEIVFTWQTPFFTPHGDLQHIWAVSQDLVLASPAVSTCQPDAVQPPLGTHFLVAPADGEVSQVLAPARSRAELGTQQLQFLFGAGPPLTQLTVDQPVKCWL